MDLFDWLDERSGDEYLWYVKRLSANDTQTSGSHQASPYLPKSFLFQLFPELNRRDIRNHRIRFPLTIESHPSVHEVCAIYYNNRFHGNSKSGRNETRLTGFGGSASPFLDPDSTGVIAVFAFRLTPAGEADECRVWVCRHETEDDVVEDRIGPVEPGKGRVWPPRQLRLETDGPILRTSCAIADDEIPASWLERFPTGAEIIAKAIELRSDRLLPVDKRLIRRRACEYELFLSVERAVELPRVSTGFATVDDFVARANSILQRRKSRAGRSLELHTRHIFAEEGLTENHDFSFQPESEPGKRPDFLFPSQAAYQDAGFPADRLRMLAVKTTCRDRWRQVMAEADRVPAKHLLTVQEGVSENQFREMTDAGVQLVVPAGLTAKYPKSVRPHLQTLESFIGDVRLLTP